MITPSLKKRYIDLLTESLEAQAKIHGNLRVIEDSLRLTIESGYVPEHFKSYELVPKVVYDELGDKSLWHFDSKILWTLDTIWEWYKSILGDVVILVNTWWWGGDTNFRGYRPRDATWKVNGKIVKTNKWSMHCDWRAIDFNVYERRATGLIEVPPQDVRDHIVKNKDDSAFQYITRIEKDTPTWTHIDFANISERIKTFC